MPFCNVKVIFFHTNSNTSGSLIRISFLDLTDRIRPSPKYVISSYLPLPAFLSDSPPLSLSIYLTPLYLSVSLFSIYLYLPPPLSLYLRIYLLNSLSIYLYLSVLSIFPLSIYLHVSLSICLSLYLSNYLFICPSVYHLSLFLSISSSIYRPIYPHIRKSISLSPSISSKHFARSFYTRHNLK